MGGSPLVNQPFQCLLKPPSPLSSQPRSATPPRLQYHGCIAPRFSPCRSEPKVERLEWKRLNVECPDQDTSLKGGRGRHTIDPPRRHVLLLPIIYLPAAHRRKDPSTSSRARPFPHPPSSSSGPYIPSPMSNQAYLQGDAISSSLATQWWNGGMGTPRRPSPSLIREQKPEAHLVQAAQRGHSVVDHEIGMKRRSTCGQVSRPAGFR